MRPRFNMRWLLLLVAVSACGAWFATQYGMVHGEFEILHKDMSFDESGRANGTLQWRFSRVTAKEVRWGDAVCMIENVRKGNLENWNPGDKVRVRYRLADLGPLKRGDPFRMFMIHSLGIPEEDIVGQVILNSGSQIIVKGSR